MKRPTTLFVLALLLAMLFTGCEQLSSPYSGSAKAASPSTEADSTFCIHFIDVGQADSILVQCDGEAMLVDGGNVADSSLVVSYLERQSVTELQYMVCTHAHEDHVGGLSGPLNTCAVAHVLCPVVSYDSKAFSDFLKYTAAQNLSLTVPAPGDCFSLGSAEVTVLGPCSDYEGTNTNNTSIVLMVEYGATRFLLTGDMESDAELELVEAGYDLHADVLKVGHHGSSTSSCAAFLAAVGADYAVISCGVDNDYGHPHWETLSALSGTPIYRTDEAGTIVCSSDGTALTFTTEKEYTPLYTEPAQYIGNINSKVFHANTCGRLPNEENRIYFDSYLEALDAGYTPHRSCLGG